MKALVTGGGGFLGGAIVRKLVERGAEVRSFSRTKYPALELLDVEQFTGHLADPAAVGEAARGCDVVFHVAAKAGVWGPHSEYHSVNVVGTRNVIDACHRHGVGRLIFTSSPSVTFAGVDQDGIAESEGYPPRFLASYPATKAESERMALAANGDRLAVVALRPHLIWGPGDPHLIPRLVDRARKGKLRLIGRRPNLVDTTFVENAADAHLCALDRLAVGSACAGKAYFISNGEPMPLWDFLNRILAVNHLPPVTRSVPPWLAFGVGALMEMTYRLLRLHGEPPMTRFVARQLATAHWFDIAAARRDLGYDPAVTVEAGLALLAAAT